jgi:CRISPR-associated protein Cas1
VSILYVSEQGAYLHKNAGRFVVTKGDEELLSVPEAAVEQVVVFGNVQISTQAVSEFLAQGIDLIYLTYNGKFKGILQSGYPKNTSLRLLQYECALDPVYRLAAARAIVDAKCVSESSALSLWKKRKILDPKTGESVARNIDICRKSLPTKHDVSALMGQEAAAARSYFDAFGEVIPLPFLWEGRNRQPPRDPVNALISLTYMMVLSEIVSRCYAHSVDPFVGFLHMPDYGRPNLALDLLEPFRAVYCDDFVLRLLHSDVFSSDDFLYSSADGCRLRKEAMNEYLGKYRVFREKGSGNRPSLVSQISIVILALVHSMKERSCFSISPHFESR